MTLTRILAVGDATAVRDLRILLEDFDELELLDTPTGHATAGLDIRRVRPDVVLLTLDSPGIDGLQTMSEIRERHPTLPVILISEMSETAGRRALFALERGASDFVHRPNWGQGERAGREWARQLRRKILALVDSPLAPASLRPRSERVLPSIRSRRSNSVVRVIAIGSSTGGPSALSELFCNLEITERFPPIVVVNHMPEDFIVALARRLSEKSQKEIRIAESGIVAQHGSIWLAPGGRHLRVERSPSGPHLILTKEPKVHSCRPAVDPLFFSLARAYGAETLAVVLTGMGKDGFAGSQAIREAGGTILVQDEESSAVWGMPGFVARAGLAEACLPPAELGVELSLRIAPQLKARRSEQPHG